MKIGRHQKMPAEGRLCGWESVADIPDKSQFSRAFKAFAKDDVESKALAAILAAHWGNGRPTRGGHDFRH